MICYGLVLLCAIQMLVLEVDQVNHNGQGIVMAEMQGDNEDQYLAAAGR